MDLHADRHCQRHVVTERFDLDAAMADGVEIVWGGSIHSSHLRNVNTHYVAASEVVIQMEFVIYASMPLTLRTEDCTVEVVSETPETEDEDDVMTAMMEAAEAAEETEALVEWLEKQAWSEFATDVAKFYRERGFLSDKQIAAARSMMAKVEARNAERAAEKAAKAAEYAVATAAPVPMLKRTFPDADALPAGRFAVARDDIDGYEGTVDLDFFRVDRPDTGRWAGRVFVKRVVGGHRDQPLRYAESLDAAERIVAAGWSDAMKRYGIELGYCGRCAKSLTDAESRKRGIGPTCWHAMGMV